MSGRSRRRSAAALLGLLLVSALSACSTRVAEPAATSVSIDLHQRRTFGQVRGNPDQAPVLVSSVVSGEWMAGDPALPHTDRIELVAMTIEHLLLLVALDAEVLRC